MSQPDGHLVARDASTLREVLTHLDAAGYDAQFRVLEGAHVQCLTCRAQRPARDVSVEQIERLEGASDPADMLMVAALRCPSCNAGGTLVVNYGPETTPEDAAVIDALPVSDSRQPARG